MKINLTKIIPAAAAALTVLAAFAGSPKSNWDDDARRRKLDYIYMESRRLEALDSLEPTFDFLKRAYRMDTTNTQVASELAYYYISMAQFVPELLNEGIDMMRRRFVDDPGDLTNSSVYGTLLSKLGNTEESIRVWHVLDSIYPEKLGVKMQYANVLYENGDSTDMPKVIKLIEQLEVASGPSAHLAGIKAGAYIEQGDTAGAAASFSKLIGEAPLVSDNYLAAGHFYAAIHRQDSAIYYYDRACEVDSTNGMAFYTRADYYWSKKDSAAFIRETAHALLNTDLDVEVKHDMMLNYTRAFYTDSTQFEPTDALFAKLIDRYPHESSFRTLYSTFLTSSKKFSQAAEQADAAVDIDPSDPAMWSTDIALHSFAEDYSAALEASDRALTYHPKNAEIHRMRGSVLLNLNRDLEAIEAFNTAIELVDSADTQARSDLLGSIGDTYHRLNQREKSVEAYEQALELNPGNLMVMNNMAYFMAVDEVDLDRAEELSRKTIDMEPENPSWLDTYAWVLFKKRDYAKAMEYIDKAVAASTDPSAEVLEHAGDIHFMNGDPDGAVEYWEKALVLDPDNDLLSRKVAHKTYFYK